MDQDDNENTHGGKHVCQYKKQFAILSSQIKDLTQQLLDKDAEIQRIRQETNLHIRLAREQNINMYNGVEKQKEDVLQEKIQTMKERENHIQAQKKIKEDMQKIMQISQLQYKNHKKLQQSMQDKVFAAEEQVKVAQIEKNVAEIKLKLAQR